MNQEQPQKRTESDVARLLMTIDQEYQSALYGFSGLNVGTARHDFINHRMERIGVAAEELKHLLGEDTAGRLIVEQMTKAVDRGETN